MELAVTITNVKNQPPQWERESYDVVIPENTVRDTPIVVRLILGLEQSVCEYLHGCLVQIGMHALELLDWVFKTRTMHLRGMSKYAVLAAACGLEFLETVAVDSSCLRSNANIMHSAFLM